MRKLNAFGQKDTTDENDESRTWGIEIQKAAPTVENKSHAFWSSPIMLSPCAIKCRFLSHWTNISVSKKEIPITALDDPTMDDTGDYHEANSDGSVALFSVM